MWVVQPLHNLMREKRLATNEAQKAIAARLGVSQANYSQWELGARKVRDREHLEAIATWLDLSFRDVLLLAYDEDPDATDVPADLAADLAALKQALVDKGVLDAS